MTASVNNSQHR